jgi:hypothetical protein
VTWRVGARLVEEQLGNAYFHSDEVGSLSFRDIGNTHISGDSKESWGVLITYQGRHMVGRYDGGNGLLEITWDEHLQALVGGKMTLRNVLLDPLVPLLKADSPVDPPKT